jgi:hypothetical protein
MQGSRPDSMALAGQLVPAREHRVFPESTKIRQYYTNLSRAGISLLANLNLTTAADITQRPFSLSTSHDVSHDAVALCTVASRNSDARARAFRMLRRPVTAAFVLLRAAEIERADLPAACSSSNRRSSSSVQIRYFVVAMLRKSGQAPFVPRDWLTNLAGRSPPYAAIA